MNTDHFFLDALTIAGGFGAVAIGILATTRAQEWRDARRKRRQAREFNLAVAENVRLAAKTLVGSTDSPTPGSFVEAGKFADMAQRTPTVDERLKALERRIAALEQDSNAQKHVNRNACARADGIEAKLSKLEERVRQIDEARKIHEDVVGGVLKRHRAEIDILAKRRAPKKRAR